MTDDEASLSAVDRRARRRAAAAAQRVSAAAPAVGSLDTTSAPAAEDEDNLVQLQEAAARDYRMGATILDDDVVDHAPNMYRQAPPGVTYADSVYAQDASGAFKCVDASAGSGNRMVSDPKDRHGAQAGGSIGGGSGSTGGSYGGGGRDMRVGGEGKAVPDSFELQVASAVYNLVIAPNRFAPGLLAGAAAYEAAVLSLLQPQGASPLQPLPTIMLYAGNALHLHRLMLWSAFMSFVGVCLRMLVRGRGNHYILQPWRRVLDATLLILFAILICMTFANRQLAWSLSSAHTASTLPFFAPATNLGAEAVQLHAQLMRELYSSSTMLAARDVLAILTALLSLIPASDEYFARVPPYLLALYAQHSRNSRAAVQPSDSSGRGRDRVVPFAEDHVLRDGHGFVEGGVTFLIAFWSVRGYMTDARPPERAPDGGPALRPLPSRTMGRNAYGWRVCACMLVLFFDVGINIVSDTVHWREALNENQADLIASIITFVIMVGMRTLFAITFFLIIATTAHFRLGRYAELFHDFGGAMLTMFFSLVGTIVTRVFRMVMEGLTRNQNTNTFWTTSFGVIFSCLSVLHAILTAMYYVKAVSALRRLAASEYHTHPDVLRRSRQNPNASFQTGAQMMPL